MEEALIIFVKNPNIERVKTRLAEDIGDEKATQVYRLLQDHTREVALEAGKFNALFYGKLIDDEDDWSEEHFDKLVQRKGDLGIKMANAFYQMIKDGFESMVLIGSDCYDISADHIHQAFKALEDHDVVIGPAEDGGYYLIGMKDFHPRLFADKKWSSEDVFKDSITTLEELGLSYFELEKLSDIDYLKDLERYPKLMKAIE